MTTKQKLTKIKETLTELSNWVDSDLIEETDPIVEEIPFENINCGSLKYLARDIDLWTNDVQEIINRL